MELSYLRQQKQRDLGQGHRFSILILLDTNYQISMVGITNLNDKGTNSDALVRFRFHDLISIRISES